MASNGEVSKCILCKCETTSASSWNSKCDRCRLIVELKRAGDRIVKINEYIASDKPLEDIKQLSDWKRSKRKNVIVSFFRPSDMDPLAQNGVDDSAYILSIPSYLGGGGNSIVMVGNSDEGWWFRRGRLNKDGVDHDFEPVHEVTLYSPIDEYEMRHFHRMDEALFQAIVKDTRPIITL